MIDEIKDDNDKEHRHISDRFEKLENKFEELSKFRWQVGGVAAVSIVLVTVFNSFAPRFITVPSQQQSVIERKK
jgi:hypothetical protein